MEQALFYLFSAIILGFAIMVVTTRRILRAAIYLLFVLGATAAIYFMLHYNFLAAVQITVYAGGIVVLIIFSILLTSKMEERLEVPALRKMLFSGIVCAGGAFLCLHTILTYSFNPVVETTKPSDVKLIGEQMLNYGANGYVLPFEVISVLLLAAMVGAIIIAKKGKPQNP